jgi:hypothetical protein
MASISPQILQTLRQRGGVATAVELQASLGVSQPTATLPEWERAKQLAAVLWAAAAGDARISDGFRAVATRNLKEIGA